MKILLMSDIHGALGMIDAAAHEITGHDIIVIAGDITHTGTRAEADTVIGRIEKHAKMILGVHGNWDRPEVGDLLDERGYSLHAKGRIVGDVGFFGVGGSSPTPIHTRTEYREEQIAAFIADGYHMTHGSRIQVCVSHVPPKGAVDKTFLYTSGGSTAARDFILKNPVHLFLCGHIHEAAGTAKLHHTTVINSGSFKKGKFVSINIGGIGAGIQVQAVKLK